MKKLLAALVALTSALSLCACGNDAEGKVSSSSQPDYINNDDDPQTEQNETEAVLSKFFDAYGKADAETVLLFMFPKDIQNDKDYKETLDAMQEFLEEDLEENKETYGEDFTYQLDSIGAQRELDAEQIKAAENYFKDGDYGKNVTVEKGVEVECTIKTSGSEKTDTEDDVICLVYVKNDGWKIITSSAEELMDVYGEEEETEPATEEVTEPAGDKNQNGGNNGGGSVELSSDLKDFTFELDGTAYTVPCKYEDFTSNGWTISSRGVFETDEIAANKYASVNMAKGGNTVTLFFANLTGNAQQLSDCKIGGIEVTDYYVSSPDFFKVGKDVTMDFTTEAIESAFGSADSIRNNDNYDVLSYDLGDDSSVTFYAYKDDVKYNNVVIKNFVKDESDKTETNSDVPEFVKNYKAPSELGSDINSGNVEIAGVLVSLPAPITEFTNAGWKITKKPGSVPSGSTDSVRLEKDGASLYLSVKNFASYQTIPENCMVYSISCYDSDKYAVKIANNVTIGTAKDEAVKLFPADVSTSQSNGKTYYNYYGKDGKKASLTLAIDDASGLVVSINYRVSNLDQ